MLEAGCRSADPVALVERVDCESQIGSGALPTRKILSGTAIRPASAKAGTRRDRARHFERLARTFRELPIPVIGRLEEGALLFDLRCLEDEAAFLDQLPSLKLPGLPPK